MNTEEKITYNIGIDLTDLKADGAEVGSILGGIAAKATKEAQVIDKAFKTLHKTLSGYIADLDGTPSAKELEKMLKEYQKYVDKSNKIESKFDKRIDTLKSQNENGQNDEKIAKTTKKKNETLAKQDFAVKNQELDFAKLFGNMDEMTQPLIVELRDKVKNWVDVAGKNLSTEELNVVTEAFNSMDISVSEKDHFAVLKTSMEDYVAVAKRVPQANADVKAAQLGVSIALREESEATDRLIQAESELEQARQSGDQQKITQAVTKHTEAQTALQKATENSATSVGVLTKAEADLADAQVGRDAKVKDATASLQDVGTQGMKAVGAAQDVKGILGNLGVDVPKDIAGAIEGVGTMMNGLSTMDLTSPMSIVTGSIKVVAGMVQSITSLFGGNKKTQAELARRQSEDLEKRKTAEMEISQLYRERYDWAQKIGESTLNHIKRQGEELDSQTTANEKDQQDLLDKLYNTDYKSGQHIERNWLGKEKIVEDRDSLAGKSWQEIELLAESGKLSEEGMKYYQAVKEARVEGDALAKRQEEYLEQMKEITTGSTYQGVVSGIVEGFKAGKRSASDFAKSFDDLMQGAVVSALNLLADQKMRKWYDDFAEKGEGGYTEDEIAQAKQEYIDYLNQLELDAKALEEVTGITIGGEVGGREAAKRGIATASQESVDENNGRLTAIQSHTNELNDTLKVISPNIASIKDSMDFMRDNASDQLVALNGILSNTTPIAAMQSEISLMRGDINTLVVKGISIIR